MEDKKRVVSGVVGKIKELKADIKRSVIEKKPQLFINIIELENDGPRKIVQELREIYKESVNEVEMVEEEEKKVNNELREMKEKLQKALDEKFRFKELYINEIKRFNDARLYINNQKNMRKNGCSASKIS